MLLDAALVARDERQLRLAFEAPFDIATGHPDCIPPFLHDAPEMVDLRNIARRNREVIQQVALDAARSAQTF